MKTLATLILAALLTACGGGDPEPEPEPAGPTMTTLPVAKCASCAA